MKITKKTITASTLGVLLLCVILASVVLSGCSSQQSAPSSTQAVTATQAQQETQAQTTAPAQQETVAAQQNNAGIDLEKAKSIALADAGFDASQVQFKKANLDTDDGVQKYEIEFINGATEYEYDIDAQTGAIIEKSNEPVND